MKLALLAAGVLLAGAPARGETPKGAQLMNLNCMEALVAVDQASLAGVFSFVPEKDGPAAFADLLVHNAKALKKFTAKLEKDLKETSGLSAWDHEAVAFALSIYASPLAARLDKPSPKALARLAELGQAPSLTLEQMTARRSKP
jgi:hypothetical protein